MIQTIRANSLSDSFLCWMNRIYEVLIFIKLLMLKLYIISRERNNILNEKLPQCCNFDAKFIKLVCEYGDIVITRTLGVREIHFAPEPFN